MGAFLGTPFFFRYEITAIHSSMEGEWAVTAEEQGAILAQLGASFSPNEIKWRVTHTSKDGKRGAAFHSLTSVRTRAASTRW